MGTPPTFVAEYESSYDATTPKTVSVTVAAGDELCIIASNEDASMLTLATPTGGGLTYTLAKSVVVASYCGIYAWTAPSASSQTYTLSISRATGTTGVWGFNCLRFSGSAGVGASSNTNVASGAPSLALTTTAANSAIVAVNGDWNAGDGSSRTWRTINSITPSASSGEQTYFRDAARFTAYGAFWSDVGTAGSKTTGLTAPTGQKYSIVAVEIQGSSGSTVDGTATIAGAGAIAATVVESVTAALTGAGAISAPVGESTGATIVGAGALTAPVVQGSSSSPTGAGVLSVNVTELVRATLTGAGALTASAVESVTATLTGAGVLTASTAGTTPGTATLVGAGALTAPAVQSAPATFAGAGVLTVPGVESVTATLTGTGALGVTATQSAPAGIAGAGAIAATVVESVTAASAGVGVVSATGTVPGGATAALAGAGILSASATMLAGASSAGTGTLAAVGSVDTLGGRAHGWWGLLSILQDARQRQYVEDQWDRHFGEPYYPPTMGDTRPAITPPRACPNCGEPLQYGPGAQLYCRFDGWMWDQVAGV